MAAARLMDLVHTRCLTARSQCSAMALLPGEQQTFYSYAGMEEMWQDIVDRQLGSLAAGTGPAV